MRSPLDWLIHTDAGLLARVGIGTAIFLALAILDLRRNGSRATRWREYMFLLAVVSLAMLYGAINDQITSRISWEYFFYGKGLSQTLGPTIPPDAGTLSREAMKIGLKATWSAGLIIGVALLLANNPSRSLPQLPYRHLMWYVPLVLLCCATSAVVLGLLGYHGMLIRLSSDFMEMQKSDEFRPQHFMAVFGIHLGGYVGGLIGTILACISIRLKRRRQKSKSLPFSSLPE